MPGAGAAQPECRPRASQEKQTRKSGWKGADAESILSTGTPGGLWKYRLDHLTSQIPGGVLDGLPRRSGLGFQSRLGMEYLDPGYLAGSIQSCIPLGVPLLYPLLSSLVDFSPRLAQLGGIIGCPGLGFGNGLLCIFKGALG